MRAARLTPLEKFLWNAIEDWRVEHALAEHYPGCAHNFRCLIRHECLDSREAGNTNPAFSVLNWLLYTLRSWDVPELEAKCEKEAKNVEASYPGLLQQVDSLVQDIPQKCASTAEALVHAKQIAALLVSHDNMQELLEDENTFPKNMGEGIAEELNRHSINNGYGGWRIAVTGKLNAAPLPPECLAQSFRACRALRSRLQGLLQARTLQRCQSGRNDKLDTKRLYRLAVQNGRVFQQRGYRQSLCTSVHILLDVSGSMQNRISLATASCHAVASTLYSMGINVAVTAIPASTGDPDMCGVCPLLRHGQKIHTNFALNACGSTPLGESLWWVMQTMLPLPESRKIILIITDGAPDTYDSVRLAMEQSGRVGMEVYGIGIDAPCLDSLCPNSINIMNMDELPPALFRILQNAMLHTI